MRSNVPDSSDTISQSRLKAATMQWLDGCTLGRPSAVCDISTRSDREQWRPGGHLLKLNPKGRTQTRKRRAEVAMPRQLEAWLAATRADGSTNGWLINWRGNPVRDVGTSWDRMLTELGLPRDREHKSYLVRRSMATILRCWHHERGRTKVDAWELEAQLGHRRRSTTEVYALANPNARDTVQTALQEVLDELERLAPGGFHRRNTGAALAPKPLRLVANNEKPRISEGL